MLIVCDSGSTKADWLVAEDGRVTGRFESPGFNPFFHDRRFILAALKKNRKAIRFKDVARQVFFFGAGCSSPARKKIIRDALRSFFTGAKVEVEHDMLGAAKAACQGKPGVVCILGTGSNAAWYDGKRLSKTVHGLGYVLGDEGSGSHFGKKLIALYLYGRMPVALRKSFRSRYRLTRETAIRHVYHRPHANVFLASFAPFLSVHKKNKWIRSLVYEGLCGFYDTNIAAYPQHKNHPVHFIGSIAYHFEDVLKRVGNDCGFSTGRILVRPVDSLMAYYLKEQG